MTTGANTGDLQRIGICLRAQVSIKFSQVISTMKIPGGRGVAVTHLARTPKAIVSLSQYHLAVAAGTRDAAVGRR